MRKRVFIQTFVFKAAGKVIPTTAAKQAGEAWDLIQKYTENDEIEINGYEKVVAFLRKHVEFLRREERKGLDEYVEGIEHGYNDAIDEVLKLIDKL